MPELPTRASVGDCAKGPDGRLYRYGADRQWTLSKPRPYHPFPDEAHLSEEEQDRIAAAVNEQIKAKEKAERMAMLARHMPPDNRTAAQKEDELDDMCATVLDGEYAAVRAEAVDYTRVDGWTAERRILFLERLAEYGSVSRAARIVNMTRQSVRKLRLRNPAFDAAYREIWHQTTELLGEGAVERALNGSQQEVYHKGELVGTRTIQHDRLLCYLLRVRDPMNYAPVDELERWQRHRGLELPGASVRLADPLLTAPAASPNAGENDENTPSPG